MVCCSASIIRTLWEIGETHLRARRPAVERGFNACVLLSQSSVLCMQSAYSAAAWASVGIAFYARTQSSTVIKESIVSSSPGIIYRLIVSPLLKWSDYMHSLSNYQQHFSDCGFQRQWELLLMLITQRKRGKYMQVILEEMPADFSILRCKEFTWVIFAT